MDSFRMIYCFESPDAYIFETKRTDLPKDADLKDVYQWFYLNRSTHHLKHLVFRSMIKGAEEQSRTFLDAQFVFNSVGGTFQETSGEPFFVTNISSQELPREVRDSVGRWMQL